MGVAKYRPIAWVRRGNPDVEFSVVCLLSEFTKNLLYSGAGLTPQVVL
jgi:hypothetical protein